jgi:hypothetical protein
VFELNPGRIHTTYDGVDQICAMTDPRNRATVYTLDGLGEDKG